MEPQLTSIEFDLWQDVYEYEKKSNQITVLKEAITIAQFTLHSNTIVLRGASIRNFI